MIDATKKEMKMFDINLQLFAGDNDYDDLDDEDLDLDSDSDSGFDNDDDYDENSYEDNQDQDEDERKKKEDPDWDGDEDSHEQGKAKKREETDASPKAKVKDKDKVTHALIEQKRLNRDLKAKLDAIEQKTREEDEKLRKKTLMDKLIDKGYDEDEAKIEVEKQLENETIKNTVKKLEFITEHADILAKYPKAKQNIDKLIKLQKSTGWSIDKICRVEYVDVKSAFDKKVNSDQEARLKQKKRPITTPAGGQTPFKSFKIEPEDEKAYQFYAKKNPGVSKKQYVERLNQQSNQKIPHDKWD